MTGPKICAKTLEGAGVRLEPLTREHFDGLKLAADAPEIWTHVPTSAAGDGFAPWFETAVAIAGVGKEVVWVVRNLGDGAIVGSTRYLNIDADNRRVEIGHTWYVPSTWGTFVNPACKLLLLRYAFEDLRLHRVELKTDVLNRRSQAAIAKLGAGREGVFRAHMVRRDGTLRDTVYFSIIREEWAAVRGRLERRLALAPAEA
jgi:RimJ/RimL family protein N-acetyltransferase